MTPHAATMALKARGRLNQTCPADCRSGWRRSHPGPEAAGYRCSACGTPTGAACWTAPEMRSAQRDGLARYRASCKQETAKPEAVA